MIVYLAGHHNADAYRELATGALVEAGHRVLNPLRPERDYRHREGMAVESIVRGDLAEVVECTHVLANFSKNSVGTSMECWFAHSIGRPVIAFVESAEMRISPWVRYIARDGVVRTSILDALEDLCPGCFSS